MEDTNKIKVFRGSLSEIQRLIKRSQRLAWLAEALPKLEGTGIIYHRLLEIKSGQMGASLLPEHSIANRRRFVIEK